MPCPCRKPSLPSWHAQGFHSAADACIHLTLCNVGTSMPACLFHLVKCSWLCAAGELGLQGHPAVSAHRAGGARAALLPAVPAQCGCWALGRGQVLPHQLPLAAAGAPHLRQQEPR